MKYIPALLTFILVSCAAHQEEQTFEVKLSGINKDYLISKLHSEKTPSRSIASLSGLSLKTQYFYTLLEQRELLTKKPSPINSCPYFHHDWIVWQEKYQSKPKKKFNYQQVSHFTQGPFPSHIQRMDNELGDLCEYGSSDGYFVFYNFNQSREGHFDDLDFLVGVTKILPYMNLILLEHGDSQMKTGQFLSAIPREVVVFQDYFHQTAPSKSRMISTQELPLSSSL